MKILSLEQRRASAAHDYSEARGVLRARFDDVVKPGMTVIEMLDALIEQEKREPGVTDYYARQRDVAGDRLLELEEAF